MKIAVKDPSTGALLNAEARPEKYNGIQGYRILHQNGSNFFIFNRSGAWRQGDSHHLEPALLANIGMAIEGNKLSEQISGGR